ncbi:MAG: substrate-binding domain-containing protein [Methylacidiphilales bacterium]|nr:substrate-binding domain-containing protein [Candidatus Methylacidiphilales bacterium]
MAVSLALRNHTSVSKKRRAKIRAIAKQLNYSPDPNLSALAAYRQTHYPRPTATPIAWISNFPTRNYWIEPAGFVNRYFQGATRRAREIGYHLEHFWLGEPGMTPQRLSKILYTRGISGILLTPQHRSYTHLNLDWDKFCAVTFGYSLIRPSLHMTTTNHYRSLGMVMRKLRSLGYRRIGLMPYLLHDTRVLHNFHAAYLMDRLRVPVELQIPVYFVPDYSQNVEEEKLEWFRAHRPEVIITSNGSALDGILRSEGLRCPEDIGLVSLGTSDRRANKTDRIISGADENYEEVGVAAMDLLVTLMHRNERGVPSTPRTVLIDSKWVSGTTVRRLNTDATVPDEA